MRALIVIGGNPALSFPDQIKTERALSSLELLVVVDPFLTATARLADYVIAPTLCLERPDTTLFMDTWYPQPYAMYTPALVEPPGETLPDWAFLWGLAAAPRQLRPSSRRPDRHEDEAHQRRPDRQHLDAGRASRWRRSSGTRAVASSPASRYGCSRATRESKARLRLLPDEVAGELAALAAEPPVEGAGYRPGERFTHRLVCRRMKEVFNSMGRELPSIRAKRTTNPAYLCPARPRSPRASPAVT